MADRDPFHNASLVVLACRTCGETLDLGIVHRDDGDLDVIELARRIKREAPEMIDAVLAYVEAHRDHEWSTAALMPARAYDERTKN